MIPLFKVLMSDTAASAANDVLNSGFIGQGPKVDQFETALEHSLDCTQPPLTLNSCTSALDLALRLAGVTAGSEVITTAQTCTATNSPILTQGAIPVWADVSPVTGLIDPESVAKLIGPKTMAIMAVDWAGRPCNYSALRAFGLPVIEDAAHAFRATVRGESIAKAGGDYVCWSFQAIKHLTTVDGGALKCPADQVERARLLRWYGLDRTGSADFRCAQNIAEVGFKYHMNDVNASIGLANLQAAEEGVERHRDNAAFYTSALSGICGVTPPERDYNAAWWIYPLLVDDRPSFEAHMKEAGIATSQVHARNDTHDAFKRVAKAPLPLRGLDEYSAHQVSIPVGWWVTNDERQYIADEVIRWATRR
jgi:dTDP-4-amino-4,6-dideoxygalactose transaminase